MNLLTPIHGRRALTRAVLGYYARCRKDGLIGEHVVIATDAADADLARECGCEVVIAANEPLGAKFNSGIERATQQADTVMITGSDAVVSRSYLRLANMLSASVPWICPRSLYALDTTLGKARMWYFDRLLTGTGQVVTRAAWDEIGMEWYAARPLALDASLYSLMEEAEIKPVYLDSQAALGLAILTIKLAQFENVTGMQPLLDRHAHVPERKIEAMMKRNFDAVFASEVMCLL